MRMASLVCVVAIASISSGFAGDQNALVRNLQAGKVQTLVTYGTSLTAGGAWVRQLQDALDRQYPGLAKVANSGAGAMWSKWGVDHLEERVLAKKPDAVLIEFAINDAFLEYKTSTEEARKNLENMIDRILHARPQCQVILMTMNPPIGVHLEARPKVDEYYELYRRVAQERKLLLIDHNPNWKKLLQEDAAAFNKYVPDGIHPNGLGCETVILPQLLKSLGIGRFGQGNDLIVENASLAAKWDAKAARLSVVAKPSGLVVIKDGRLGEGGGTGTIATVQHKVFGQGNAIKITHRNGARQSVMVFPNVPFVLLGTMLHNDGAEPLVTNHIRVLSTAVDLAKPLGELRGFGTAGLRAVEKCPGSYAYLALVDPATRAGVVGGWITHDRGSGVVLLPVEEDTARLEAQIDYGRLRIKPGADAEAETFALGWFADARLGLEAYADAVARVYSIKLPPQPSGYCTWYAEKYGGGCDEKHLAELAVFAAKELIPFGFEFVQIDDQWQAGVSTNGPNRNFTLAAPKGPYPSGMKATANNLNQLGLTPGIWFMPFAGTSYDPFFKDHQDWFAKTADGKPFETTWGGTCLDLSQPGAREHVRDVVQRIAHEWGYRLFKMDGLWTGTATRLMYVNDGYADDHIGEALLHDPDKTQVEAFRDGLKLVREVAGPKVFLLGCCVSQNMRSFGGSFGLLDAMRVGPDTGAGQIGSPHASRNYFLHGRVWQNDPDCVSVRASTSLSQARVNASFTAIAGHLFYNSDWLPDLSAERLEILKRTLPAHGLRPRPVDVFENDPARIWLLTDTRQTPRRDVVALFNWNQSRAATLTCALDRLSLPASQEFVAFDFWANQFVPPFREKLSAQLPAASCRVLAVRPVSYHPQLLSTSRHVTQGIVDVLEEKWDAAAQTLEGLSRVVANDPYELRMVVPISQNSWRAQALVLSAEDGRAGVQSEFKQDGPKLRATLTSPASREVRWHVKFAAARIESPVPPPVTGLEAAADYGAVTLSWVDAGADGYRVTRSDGTQFAHADRIFTDATVAHGKHYRYTVQSIGWGETVSEPASVEVATPAELKPPPLPPLPEIFISDLKPLASTTGWGQPGINKSVEGKPLTVGGKTYQRGLGTHANGLAVFGVPAGARRFVAVVGLDDEKQDDPRSSVIFETYGDVKEMGELPVMLARSPILSSKTVRFWTFDLKLNSRFKELRLVVTDAGDGMAADHADWVNAGFVK